MMRGWLHCDGGSDKGCRSGVDRQDVYAMLDLDMPLPEAALRRGKQLLRAGTENSCLFLTQFLSILIVLVLDEYVKCYFAIASQHTLIPIQLSFPW